MRKVIGIGETVLDIIFKNEQPVGAYPGGSTFNAVISLARAGAACAFIGETGNDRVGQGIIRFLKENGVDTSSVNTFPGSKSPVTLAFLDTNNDADYIFYKDHPHDQLDMVYPDIQADDIVIIGSFFAVNPVIRPQLTGFLDADIVRGSHEDFKVLYKLDNPDKVYKAEISFYCKKFIYTQAANPVELRADGGLAKSYPARQVETVSTVGAGDSFNAGFIYGMLKYGIRREHIEQGLTEEQWDKMIDCAQDFSANCCGSIYNYISVDFGKTKRLISYK